MKNECELCAPNMYMIYDVIWLMMC